MALDGAALICGECSEVERAIRAAKSEQPDIALIGREITGDWRAAVRGVCRAAPECRVIVLAQTSDIDDMLESVRAGALGYVPGALTAESLRAIFRFARANEALIPRTMVAELLTEVRGAPISASGGLTGREAQVLSMVRRGHSTASIAECLADRSGDGQTAHLRARAQARRREPSGSGAARPRADRLPGVHAARELRRRSSVAVSGRSSQQLRSEGGADMLRRAQSRAASRSESTRACYARLWESRWSGLALIGAVGMLLGLPLSATAVAGSGTSARAHTAHGVVVVSSVDPARRRADGSAAGSSPARRSSTPGTRECGQRPACSPDQRVGRRRHRRSDLLRAIASGRALAPGAVHDRTVARPAPAGRDGQGRALHRHRQPASALLAQPQLLTRRRGCRSLRPPFTRRRDRCRTRSCGPPRPAPARPPCSGSIRRLPAASRSAVSTVVRGWRAAARGATPGWSTGDIRLRCARSVPRADPTRLPLTSRGP